jgi:hypothetical protein
VTETKTVSKKLTFNDGLPLGVHALFTHEGQKWIAFPFAKYQKIIGVMDRILGLHSYTVKLMVSWVNSWPEDGEKVAKVMEITQRARADARSVAMDKSVALTSIKEEQ